MTAFGNPVFLPEGGGCKVGQTSKIGPKDLFAIQSWNKLETCGFHHWIENT